MDTTTIGTKYDEDISSLNILQVIDRLEVGPVKVEKKRLIAPYRVQQNNSGDSIDLIYSYEEEVFDPADPASQNLASMIAAQVALNYGLFCQKIVFHGPFDNTDKRFILDKMENTSREIFVKKFLEPNPFLIGKSAEMPPLKLKNYTQAIVEFSENGHKVIPWKLWPTQKGKHAILSSGGKDSLLSFGLLNEIGKDVHPIFINESGRHWFTAINAYRYFQKNIPNTARVWTNADRVFNRVLRHLPFIRKDFSNVRSDEYPIRLWTVAVFLFGALPLLRKRQIGRLIIGDEYDTTIRAQHQGITHYDGLFDQSRFFDNALTRYFLRKGWSIAQFSIIRQLSEMLIEKILVERYPHLQEHQTSCHATHKEGERVHPCGKCEKCRRIVGMLLALDADPKRCGYNQKQIENCLTELATKSLHQESAGAEHLKSLLVEKGLLPNSLPAKKHPEILKLRFDLEKSPAESIPSDLRDPLYRIYFTHSDGAVKRVNRKWVETDPITDANLKQPYPFEKTTRLASSLLRRSHENGSGKYVHGELTWPEADKRFKEVDVAILPVGSIEQHGLHLPLDTDAFDAEYLAKQVAAACSNPKPLVFPLISYGVSYHHDEFPGTISISNETLSRLVYEIGISAAKNGINKLVIINGHGGNSPSLNFAAQRINQDARIFVCVDTGETSDVDISAISETPNDVHAGEIETSTSLATRPHLVKFEKAIKMVPKFSSRYLNFSSKRGVEWYAHTKKISSTGVMGDPTKASAEKGDKIWEIMIAHLVALVEDLKRMTLDEIHQQKY
jgi:creatinine amidohydrolase/Fe(II)-dependent formamide hydrolase-like protein